MQGRYSLAPVTRPETSLSNPSRAALMQEQRYGPSWPSSITINPKPSQAIFALRGIRQRTRDVIEREP